MKNFNFFKNDRLFLLYSLTSQNLYLKFRPHSTFYFQNKLSKGDLRQDNKFITP
jgi:hypothetical protein